MRHYENALAGAWVVVLFLLLIRKHRNIYDIVSLVLIPFTILMMGYGIMNVPKLEPYTPVFRTPWLVVHIIFAWFAYSSFVITFGLGVAYLVKESRQLKQGPDKDLETNLELLDELGGKFIVFGFISSTIMLLAGSIWASKLWGSYWNWDPIETWSLISWLAYGIIIHLRFTFGWRDKKFAVMTMLALTGVIVAWFGINWIPSSTHVFSKLE